MNSKRRAGAGRKRDDERRGDAMRFARTLVRVLPRRSLDAFALMLAVAFTEGVSLVALVPLLHLVGLDVGTAPVAEVARAVEVALAALGIPVSLGIVLGIYVLTTVATAALSWAARVASSRVAFGFSARMQADLHAAITRASWLHHTRSKGARLTQALTTEANRLVIGTEALLSIAVRACTAVVYVAFSLVVSLELTAFVAVTGSVLMLVFRRQVRRSRARRPAGAVSLTQGD